MLLTKWLAQTNICLIARKLEKKGHKLMDNQTNEQMNERKNDQMNEQAKEETDERTKEPTKGWMTAKNDDKGTYCEGKLLITGDINEEI